MATRLTVQTRRQALYDALKRSCCDGTYAPGAMLPSVRELGEQYEVSVNVVFGVIGSLTDEGFLYTVPRVGAFVGRPRVQTVEPYLIILPYRDSGSRGMYLQTQVGFEDRIAQLGGHSMVLIEEETTEPLQSYTLPPLAGVYDPNFSKRVREFKKVGVPTVCFGEQKANVDVDFVGFDNVTGGAQATRHLVESGHRHIAFLGLHHAGTTGDFTWSAQRAQGWRGASPLQNKKQLDDLLLLPPQNSGIERGEQVASARQTAQSLIGRADITAVVAVNALAAEGMFEAFRSANWPANQWPAVVCFDDAAGAQSSVMSYLRLPWEEVGREAAQLLWERRMGRLSGAPTQRLVAMRLIARLSCRADWVQGSKLGNSHVESSIGRWNPTGDSRLGGVAV